MLEDPLITCLCLTRDRREYLAHAIQCFEAQTYTRRELVIVADGLSDLEGLALNGFDISVIVAPGVVGRKRNVGCAAARGSVIAIWDDDDHSAPPRLAYQVGRLREAGKQLHGFSEMKFTDGTAWWQYHGQRGNPIAASLCFERSLWERFRFAEIGVHADPRSQCGQDEQFAAQSRAWAMTDPDQDLIYATVHPGNTSPRSLRPPTWRALQGFVWKEAA